MSKQNPPFPLRLEPDTRARIEAIAKANGRSLNAQIVMMLDDWLAGTNGNESPLTESRVLELIRAVPIGWIQCYPNG